MNVCFAYFQVIFMKINEQMGGLAFSETLNFFYKSGSDTTLNRKSGYKNRTFPKEFVHPHSILSFSDAS